MTLATFAVQKLDVYIAARELMRVVHAARLRETELRDHAAPNFAESESTRR